MCKWNKYGDTRIDPCMRDFVRWLNNKHKTVLSCCGHGKYPMTVIIKEYCKLDGKMKIAFKEIISGKIIRIKKNALDKDPKKFYKRDDEGYYYIPELNSPTESKEGMVKEIMETIKSREHKPHIGTLARIYSYCNKQLDKPKE